MERPLDRTGPAIIVVSRLSRLRLVPEREVASFTTFPRTQKVAFQISQPGITNSDPSIANIS
jgi:hypothetical protein